MSKTVFIILAFTLLISSHLAGQNYDQFLYKHKIERYNHLNNTGRVFLFTGGVLTTAGIISAGLLANENNISQMQMENRLKVSYVAVGVGINLIVTGFIMKSIGIRKAKEYRNKLNNLSGGFIFSPERKSFSLVYKF